ncbi:MAG: IS5 family transposase, partial [Candidatus Moranbacteria bacterium]|nr:IS5 family transposase [Candidatus Moranbacteria bacterium]
MYQATNRATEPLFPELFPWSGKLNEDNEWIKLEKIIPWEVLEGIYSRYFSLSKGRPAKDGRLIIGLLIVKHKKGISDRRLVEELLENIYLQYFCGFRRLAEKKTLHASSLTKIRKRLGKEFFAKFEMEIISKLLKEKIIKPRGLMVDATVVSANINYPTDHKLINKAREWACKTISNLRKIIGLKKPIRTYKRVARKVFLNFQKKRRKTRAVIEVTRNKLLRFLRRNLGQLAGLLKDVPLDLAHKLQFKYETAITIYEQQKHMAEEKVRHVKDRVVSFHLPHIRPIVRGKDGKDVEFGPKAVLSWVNGFGFLDKFSFEVFNEAGFLSDSLRAYKERFAALPPDVTADQLYGTRWNRKLLGKINIGSAFKSLGRKAKDDLRQVAWVKRKQRDRNMMEGIIGNAKEHYGLNQILYRIKDGEEIWTR